MKREKSRLTIEMPLIRMNHHDILVKITSKSPLKHRVAVEQIARYFQREMEYDFLQYSSRNDNAITYVFTDYHTLNVTPNDKFDLQSIGAVCFREFKYEDHEPAVMTLDWIWLHPYERGKNRISPFFNRFIDEVGYFFVSHPRSKAMTKLLESMNYPTKFEEIIARIEEAKAP